MRGGGGVGGGYVCTCCRPVRGVLVVFVIAVTLALAILTSPAGNNHASFNFLSLFDRYPQLGMPRQPLEFSLKQLYTAKKPLKF